MDRRLVRPETSVWVLVALCAAFLSACGSPPQDSGTGQVSGLPEDTPSVPSVPEPAADEERGPSPSADPLPSELWEEGATAVATEAGVLLSVPGDWTDVSEEERADPEEALLRWEEGAARYGEIGVFDLGERDAGPAAAVRDYLDFLSRGDGPSLDIAADGADTEVPGAVDAVRTDYHYPLPGREEAQAHGSILGFTAPGGSTVLVVVSGDGVHATEELTEEILGTVRVRPESEV